MGKLRWYINRLRAMNPAEVAWRIDQKRIQLAEKRSFAGKQRPVDEEIFEKPLRRVFAGRVGSMLSPLSFPKTFFSPAAVSAEIHLLGGFDYAKYRRDWHAGFQTPCHWPKTFSYDLNYKQRDDIGDARTNWELNRHFQFALLAETYAATGSADALNELQELFDDWNRQNPFLIGISWTSPMEVAIRAIQWIFASYYLSYRPSTKVDALRRRLETGAVNMVGYVATHRSRYSSANNHLLVEAASIAIAGKAFGFEAWQRLGVDILTEELPKQNSADGVNLEMALHYQSFAMEAYALVGLILGTDNIPASWKEPLQAQMRFVLASIASGCPLEFGDNDEGKILYPRNPQGHYAQVIEWLTALFGEPADPFEGAAAHFPGGYTFFRDTDGRVGIAIDHAPLGFGSIAAHGHADALSFQASLDGKPIFVDPGTYIYHCWIGERDYFRRTLLHNTLTVNGSDQSQMLGAFLWGKRAATTVISFNADADGAELAASHDGYAPAIHSRRLAWDAVSRKLTISDTLSAPAESWTGTLMLAPDCDVAIADGTAKIALGGKPVAEIALQPGVDASIADEWHSPAYGVKVPTKALRLNGSGLCNLSISIQFL